MSELRDTEFSKGLSRVFACYEMQQTSGVNYISVPKNKLIQISAWWKKQLNQYQYGVTDMNSNVLIYHIIFEGHPPGRIQSQLMKKLKSLRPHNQKNISLKPPNWKKRKVDTFKKRKRGEDNDNAVNARLSKRQKVDSDEQSVQLTPVNVVEKMLNVINSDEQSVQLTQTTPYIHSPDECPTGQLSPMDIENANISITYNSSMQGFHSLVEESYSLVNATAYPACRTPLVSHTTDPTSTLNQIVRRRTDDPVRRIGGDDTSPYPLSEHRASLRYGVY